MIRRALTWLDRLVFGPVECCCHQCALQDSREYEERHRDGGHQQVEQRDSDDETKHKSSDEKVKNEEL